MKKWFTLILMMVVTVLTVSSGIVQGQGATLARERADKISQGFEVFTALTIPGRLFYAEPIFLGGAKRTVYITFVASADTHNGARLLMRGEVDGDACTGGPGATPTAPGWQSLNKMPASTGNTNCNDGGGGDGDCHDNSVIYTCCRNVREPGLHTVSLSLATSSAGDTVFFEQGHIYVDSSKTKPGFCEAVTPLP